MTESGVHSDILPARAGGTGLSRVMRTAGPKDVADMEINEEGVMTFSGGAVVIK